MSLCHSSVSRVIYWINLWVKLTSSVHDMLTYLLNTFWLSIKTKVHTFLSIISTPSTYLLCTNIICTNLITYPILILLLFLELGKKCAVLEIRFYPPTAPPTLSRGLKLVCSLIHHVQWYYFGYLPESL